MTRNCARMTPIFTLELPFLYLLAIPGMVVRKKENRKGTQIDTVNRKLRVKSVPEIRGERQERKGQREKKRVGWDAGWGGGFPGQDLCEIRHNSCFFSTDDYKPLLPPAKLLPLCQELDTTIKVINGHV